MLQPNILFITCHDLGRHLGCYGWESVPSPALDRFAAEGVRFANSFCTAPQCSPSRASLHTGRHAHSVGVLGLAHPPFGWQLEPDQMHIARRLQQAGYKTTLVGEQHLRRDEALPQLGYDLCLDAGPAPVVAERAVAYLAQATEMEQPFYLEVGFVETHRPYASGEVQPYSAQGVDLPAYIPHAPVAIADFAALQGAIRVLDSAVGTVLHGLADQGLAQNTLVLFTTDHGLAMPRAKCTLYDPGIEAALLLRWPAAGVAGGRVVEALVSHVDVVPTLLEALALPRPPDLQGHTFWPLLRSHHFTERDAIFAEKTFHTAYEPMRAVRTATHKLIANLESGSRYDVPDDIRLSPIYPLVLDQIVGERPHLELYDLRRDPTERENLAGKPELDAIQTTLRHRLWRWMAETGDPLLQGPVASPFYRRTLETLTP